VKRERKRIAENGYKVAGYAGKFSECFKKALVCEEFYEDLMLVATSRKVSKID
jgi:hypothetical protein